MVSTGTARTIVGIIGNVISFFLFLSPVPTVVKITKQKDVEDFHPYPYIATLLNCAMWAFYGMPFVKEDAILVLTINGIGFVIEFIYVLIFFIHSPMQKRKRMILAILGEIIFMVAVVLIAMLGLSHASKRATFVGILCIIFNIIMYASPLTIMKLVIRTKSVKYMPFYLSLTNLMNGIIWVIYSLLKFDINILIPNGLGTISGVVQLILYGVYYRSTKWEDDDNSEIQITSKV